MTCSLTTMMVLLPALLVVSVTGAARNSTVRAHARAPGARARAHLHASSTARRNTSVGGRRRGVVPPQPLPFDVLVAPPPVPCRAMLCAGVPRAVRSTNTSPLMCWLLSLCRAVPCYVQASRVQCVHKHVPGVHKISIVHGGQDRSVRHHHEHAAFVTAMAVPCLSCRAALCYVLHRVACVRGLQDLLEQGLAGQARCLGLSQRA